jgi:protein-tyrosine phosphatase
VYFTAELPGLLREHRELLTINNGSYFLLEFPADYIYSGSKEFIFTVLSDGFIPIISHPERNSAIQRSPRLLHELVKTGALCQINAGSLRGDFGSQARQTAFDLLAGNWVHVIASDAHNPLSRKLELSYVSGLLRHVAAEKVDMYLSGIPAAIVADEAPPDIGEPQQRLPRRSFFDFFKKGTS